VIAEARDIVSHHEQVARAAVAILDPIAKQRFDLEAELLEDCARAGLIGRHLRGDLPEPVRARQVEDFARQTPSEAGSLS